MDNFLVRTVKQLSLLKPEEFIGVCVILGVNIFEDGEKKNPKSGQILLEEVIDKLDKLNRTQRKNLSKLLRAATKGKKKLWH